MVAPMEASMVVVADATRHSHVLTWNS